MKNTDDNSVDVGKKGRAPKRKRLTPKRAKLVGVLIADPDLTLREAGKRAGFTGDTGEMARKSLASPVTQACLRERMERRAKLTDDALLAKLEDGLEATAVKRFAFNGNVVTEETDADFPTRHSYLTLAAKLKGLTTEKVDVTTNGKDLNAAAPALDLSFLKALTKAELLAALGIKPPVETSKPSTPALPLLDQAASAARAVPPAQGATDAPGRRLGSAQ